MDNDKIHIDDFAERISDKSGIDQEKSKLFVDKLFDYIGSNLEQEDKISIYRFGKFEKRFYKERPGINPQTQKRITIPAHYSIKFSPASHLADEVNKKYRHLKPNVLDQLLTLTGLTRLDPKLKEELEKDNTFEIAKKRALITLGILSMLFLLFLMTIILIPAYFVNENNQIVRYVNRVNRMFGLDSVSDYIRGGQVNLDEEQISSFIRDTGQALSEGRQIIDTYTIKSGDSIFSIADRYWNNQYLWPDLYLLNQNEFSDPDLIQPGQTLTIYEKLGDPDKFSRSQRQDIVEAYIGVYRIYRAIGEHEISQGKNTKGQKRIEDSRWTLYTAVRYDHSLLSRYKDAIIPEDIEIVKKYIEKFGYKNDK